MRILVVEDEADLLSGLVRTFRRSGYSVDTASTGTDALLKAQDTDYDAIVLDVMLPGLDGWTVLERLRQSKATPVLLLTARDRTADKVRGFDSGADDYLAKPFDVEELLARLRALIRRSAGHARTEIVVGDVKIDMVKRSVTCAGEAVTLTAREFGVLEYLALHRDEVVSRTALYEHLYDESGDTLSNLMDVLIYNLRVKLGRGIISTRRGQGYILAS